MDNPEPLENIPPAIKALYRNYKQRVEEAQKYAWRFLFSNIALLVLAAIVVISAPYLAKKDVKESLSEIEEILNSEKKERNAIDDQIARLRVRKFSDVGASGNGKIVIVVGEGGFIKTSGDNGKGWEDQNIKTKEDLNAITISTNGKTAIAVGENGAVAVSKNRGESWTTPDVKTRKDFNDVEVEKNGPDNIYAIAVGDKGIIRVSKDGGKTWSMSDSKTAKRINAVTVVGGTAVAVGNDGTILVSQDRGRQWTPGYVNGLTTEELEKMDFNAVTCSGDGNTVVIVGNDGTILVSQDRGRQWTRRYVNGLSDRKLKKMDFNAVTFSSDRSTVIAVGENGTIWGSTDRGGTWKAQDSNVADDLVAIALSDNGRRAVAAGEDGTILVTMDGGGTWVQRDAKTSSTLTAVVLNDDGAIFIGENSTILRSKLEKGHSLRSMKIKTISDRFYVETKLKQLEIERESIQKSLDEIKKSRRESILGGSDSDSRDLPIALFQTNFLRIGLLAVLILMSQHVIKLARYNFRLMTFYRARQDVLLMTTAEALPWLKLTPKGLEHAANALSPDHVDPELSSKNPMVTFMQSVSRRIKPTSGQ